MSRNSDEVIIENKKKKDPRYEEKWRMLNFEFLTTDQSLKKFAEDRGLKYQELRRNFRYFNKTPKNMELVKRATDKAVETIADRIVREQKHAIEIISNNMEAIIEAAVKFAMEPKGHLDRKMLLEIAGLYRENKNINLISKEDNAFNIDFDKLTELELIEFEKYLDKATIIEVEARDMQEEILEVRPVRPQGEVDSGEAPSSDL